MRHARPALERGSVKGSFGRGIEFLLGSLGLCMRRLFMYGLTQMGRFGRGRIEDRGRTGQIWTGVFESTICWGGTVEERCNFHGQSQKPDYSPIIKERRLRVLAPSSSAFYCNKHATQNTAGDSFIHFGPITKSKRHYPSPQRNAFIFAEK